LRSAKRTWFAISSVAFANLIVRFSSLAFLILLARIITVEDYGLFRSVLAMGILAGFFTTSGAAAYVARTTSYYLHDEKEVARTITAGFIIQFLFFIVSILILFLLRQLSSPVLLVLVGAIIFDYTSSILRGRHLFGTVSMFFVLVGVFKLLFLLLLGFILDISLSITAIVAIFSLSVIPALVPILLLRGKFSNLWSRHLTRGKITEGLRFSLPITLIAISHYSTINLIVPFANVEYGSAVASYLSVALTFGAILTFVPSAINFVIMPTTARISSSRVVVSNLKIYAILTSALSCIVLLGLLIFPSQAIEILFSSDYLPAAQYFPFIITGFFFLAIATVFDAVWIGAAVLRIPLITNGIGAIVNLGCILIAVSSNLDAIHLALAFLVSRFITLILIILITILKWGELGVGDEAETIVPELE